MVYGLCDFATLVYFRRLGNYLLVSDTYISHAYESWLTRSEKAAISAVCPHRFQRYHHRPCDHWLCHC